MKKSILLLLLAFTISLAGFSQAPGIFNYQGVARNSVGNVLINQNIALRLSIHDGTANGPVVYSETRALTTNPFGLFNAQVGSAGATSVTGTIAGVNWGLGNKYIQVEIDPAGGSSFINVGTAQLASVPYSIFAQTAGDIVLPFNKSQASGTILFSIANTGTAGSGNFAINNAASSATALTGTTNGSGIGILGTRTATTGTAAGVRGESSSADANAVGIQGVINPTAPGGFSAGLRGTNNGTGGLGIGVYGSQAGSGWGVYGTTPSGLGVHGNSTSGFGVYGLSTSGIGSYGLSTNSTAGLFEITNNANTAEALRGVTIGAGPGVLGVRSATTGTAAGVRGETNSADANAAGIQGVVVPTAPGGFSAGVRGVNNGTGGLGIGVYGSQAGSGWGVYGTTPSGLGVHGNSNSGFGVYGISTSGTGVYGVSSTGPGGQFEITNNANTADALQATQAGLGRGLYARINNTSNIVGAVRGETNGGGYGIFGQATGNGNAGFFQIANPASTSSTMNVTTNGIGSGVTVQLTNASNGARGVDVLQAGVGPGVFATSAGGNAVWGITSSISAAGVIGDNTFGEAVVGRNRGGDGVGAVVGRNDSTGYGVRGFNTKDGVGVLGQAGISGGTGVAGRFQNVNASNVSTTVGVATNGIGSGVTVQLTNASNGARGIDVLQAGVGPGVFATSAGGNAVWGITSSISAAGVIGDNTFGEAVVGRNRGGNGVGAVVGRNDSTGYGVRGFNTKDGIGVLGQTGISGGTGNAGRFENVNAANGNDVMIVASNGTGNALVVNNANGGATNLAVFKKNSGNVARIADNGQIFANGGFTTGGADVAEYFDAEGDRNSYEPGDVLVISESSDRKVEKSSAPYSTLVSGVYATKPGITLTEENAVDGDLSKMVPMGVIGVIPTKVCLEGGAIKRGDLLVTSSISGVAMKADPSKVQVGQVIGKALQNYDANTVGKINVLVSIK